jgi:hypothetical protein
MINEREKEEAGRFTAGCVGCVKIFYGRVERVNTYFMLFFFDSKNNKREEYFVLLL